MSIWKWWMQKHADVVDRFRVNRNQVKVIFVDETLLIQINGKDYWLWIAYEPDMDLCLMMMHIYIKRKNYYLRMLSILQTITEEIW